jgi:integrase
MTRGRCHGCYDYSRRHPVGVCTECGGEYPIGPTGSCRMCMNKRRFRHAGQDPLGKMLLTEVGAYGKSRGWTSDAISKVRASLRVILANRDRIGPHPWADTAIYELFKDMGKVANQRAVEFLVDQGMAKPDTDYAFDRWLATRFEQLQPQIADEIRRWTHVLRGNGKRARIPLQPSTIRGYVWILQQPLAAWTATYESLREVTPDDVDEQLRQFSGAKRDLAATAMRSLFKTLKAQRVIFVNPTAYLSGKNSYLPGSPIGLKQAQRARLLQRSEQPADQLMVLLAGVHALRAGQIATLRLDDVDITSRTLRVKPTRRLDRLTFTYLTAWLEYRRQRWPRTANPYLLVNRQSAGGVQHVAVGFVTRAFRKLGHTSHQLRVDRLLEEAHNTGGDPIRLIRMFGLSDPTALHYCADAITPTTAPQDLTQSAARNH